MAPGLLLSSLEGEGADGPQPTLESCVVFGSSFCSVKYRGQCQQSLLFFSVVGCSLVGKRFSLDPGHHSGSLDLPPYVPRNQGMACFPIAA